MSLKPKEQQLHFSDLTTDKILRNFKKHPLMLINERFPFERFRATLSKLYSHTGRAGYDPIRMLKLLLLGKLQNISDKRLEQDVAVNLLYRAFCGWGLDEQTPDHSTLSRFRDRIEPVWPEIWAEMIDWLRAEGLLENDLLIIDSTDVQAQGRYHKPPDQDNVPPEQKYEHQSDPDARHGHKNKDKPFYGYKAHVVMDAKSHMIVSLVTTPGQVHDGVMLPSLVSGLRYKPKKITADNIYCNSDNHAFLCTKRILDRTIPKKPHRGPRPLAYRWRKRIERINSLLKCAFGLARTRFFGLFNVNLDLRLGAMASNLVNLPR
jgi:transposase, IS5 family